MAPSSAADKVAPDDNLLAASGFNSDSYPKFKSEIRQRRANDTRNTKIVDLGRDCSRLRWFSPGSAPKEALDFCLRLITPPPSFRAHRRRHAENGGVYRREADGEACIEQHLILTEEGDTSGRPIRGPQLKRIKSWTVAAVATVFLVVISVKFLDRPLAWFFYRVLGHLMIVQQFAATPSFFGPFELFILLIFFIRRIAFYPLSRSDAALLLCEASLLTTKSLVSPLKSLFGRTWPLYGHPSLLLDCAYGFNSFTAGQEFFPSGHTASVCAVVGVLWAMYPRFRPMYALAVAVACSGRACRWGFSLPQRRRRRGIP